MTVQLGYFLPKNYTKGHFFQTSILTPSHGYFEPYGWRQGWLVLACYIFQQCGITKNKETVLIQFCSIKLDCQHKLFLQGFKQPTPEEQEKLDSRKDRKINLATYKIGLGFDLKHIKGNAMNADGKLRPMNAKADFQKEKYKKMRPATETSPGVFVSTKGDRNWSFKRDPTCGEAKRQNMEDK